MQRDELMQRGNRWVIFALQFILGLQLMACRQESDTASKVAPVRIAETGETLYRVRLTTSKAEEYNIQTAVIREEQVSGVVRKVIPSVAVVSDQHRNTWMFITPEPLVFVRNRIQVDHIAGDLAVLSEGPPVGTAVVTVGADKLLRSEFQESGESSIEKRRIATEEKKTSSGMATMQEDGTIRLVYRTQGATGLTADIVIEYEPKDEEYQKILDQVGGLKTGETKFVTHLP